MLYYGGKCEYGPVVDIFIVMIGELEMPRGPAFPSNFREVRGVRVDGKNHVTGMVADASVRMRCDKIKELVACFRDSLDCRAMIALRAVRRVESTARP
jgi:hypothetical protein